MRLLKLVLISVVVLFLVLTAFAALLPSKVRISRAVDISGRAADAREQIVTLERWKHWNVYAQELDMQVSGDTISGKRLSVIRHRPGNDTLRTTWHQQDGKSFEGIFEIIDHGKMITVHWYFNFSFRWYPWEKFSSIVYDEQVGPPMQQSLENLKALIENVP